MRDEVGGGGLGRSIIHIPCILDALYSVLRPYDLCEYYSTLYISNMNIHRRYSINQPVGTIS